MRHSTFFIFLIICIYFTGCGSKEATSGPKREADSYEEKILKIVAAPEISIISDFSDIEVYSWDKDEVKFEITKKLRGIENEEALENELNRIKLEIRQDGDRIFFECNSKDIVKRDQDKSIKLKLLIPKKVLYMDYKLKEGNIKFLDDIKCNLKMEIDKANIELNNFEGRLNLKGKMNNLKINGGKLLSGSNMMEDSGNIYIRAALEKFGEYNFETNLGDINLDLIENPKISIESMGLVEINEFKHSQGETKVKVRSSQGKILIRKI